MYRPLGAVRNIVERTGSDVSYAHDDLVFVEHTAYLLQFNDKSLNQLFIHFNEECSEPDSETIFKNITAEAKKEKFTIRRGSYFSMSQKEGTEELEITFK